MFVSTFVTEVIDQDDLCDELRRRAVEDAVNGSQQRRPAFVVKRDDDAGVGKLLCIQLVFTAAEHRCGKTALNSQILK